MPLLIFHIFEGRSQEEVGDLLDATHHVVLDTFHVPRRDRYQIVHGHKQSHVRFEDTGLGIARSNKFLLLQVVTRPHPREQKTAFYKNLQRSCGVAPYWRSIQRPLDQRSATTSPARPSRVPSSKRPLSPLPRLQYSLSLHCGAAVTLVPLPLAGAITLKISVLAGLVLNFANIIAVPLLLGVGVAFKIYYIMA